MIKDNDIGTKLWALDILERTPHAKDAVQWPDNATRDECFAAFKIAHPRARLRTGCPSCHFTVIDWMRGLCGQEPVSKEAPKQMVKDRRTACESCPAYHSATNSCGRLILDAMHPEPVEIDGVMVNPCGCRLFGLFGKATFKSSKCPAGRWNV